MPNIYDTYARKNPHEKSFRALTERQGSSGYASPLMAFAGGRELQKSNKFDAAQDERLSEATEFKNMIATWEKLGSNPKTEGIAVEMFRDVIAPKMGITAPIETVKIMPDGNKIKLEDGGWWTYDKQTGNPLIWDAGTKKWRTPTAEDLKTLKGKGKKGKDFSLSEGQARYDSEGNLIVEKPKTPATGTDKTYTNALREETSIIKQFDPEAGEALSILIDNPDDYAAWIKEHSTVIQRVEQQLRSDPKYKNALARWNAIKAIKNKQFGVEPKTPEGSAFEDGGAPTLDEYISEARKLNPGGKENYSDLVDKYEARFKTKGWRNK